MDLQPNQLWLRLRVAETIQFGGEPHVLGLVATNCAICPVRAVREHLALTTNVGPKAHLFITKPVGPKGAAAVRLSHAALVSGIRQEAADGHWNGPPEVLRAFASPGGSDTRI